MKISTFKALLRSRGYSIREYMEACETGKDKAYPLHVIDILFRGQVLATFNKRLLVEYLPLVRESVMLAELAKKEAELMPNQIYRRKIRVQTTPDDPRSYTVSITDAETGAPVENVSRVIVYLDIDREINEAQVTYSETTPTGGVVIGPNSPAQSVVTVDNLEVDITAYEEGTNGGE